MIYGVDVHNEYQAGLNIETLASEGYDFCIVKATQGVSGYWAPPEFDDWQTRIVRAGMINGAYHWCMPSDPVAQVDYFLRRIGDHRRYPIIQLDIDKATPINVVRGWVKEWKRRTNNHPVFPYPEKPTSLSFTDLMELGPIWDSDYVNGSGFGSVLYEKVPNTWWREGVEILQFSSHVDAGGLIANVDGNVFQGSKSELLALATGGNAMATWSNRAKEPAPPNFPFNGETAAVDAAVVLREGDKTGWSDVDGRGWFVVEILREIRDTVKTILAVVKTPVTVTIGEQDKADIAQEIKATIVNDVAEAVYDRIKEQFNK